MQPSLFGKAAAGGNRIIPVQFPHQIAIPLIAIGAGAIALGKALDTGLIELRAIVQLPEKRLLLLRQITRNKIKIWRIIGIGRCIGVDCVHSIQSKAIHATIKPEPRNLHKSLAHVGVGMVEIGLLGQEVMQIILLPARLPRPRTSPKEREPIGRRGSIGQRINPMEPIRLGIVTRLAAFLKPCVLIRAMRRHDIDH